MTDEDNFAAASVGILAGATLGLLATVRFLVTFVAADPLDSACLAFKAFQFSDKVAIGVLYSD